MTRKEFQMIDPIKQLLYKTMYVDVTEREFSAGYGIADIVGAELCRDNCLKRQDMGLAIPLDHVHLASVLLLLSQDKWTSFTYLIRKSSASESMLRQKILPRLKKLGIIEKQDNSFRLNVNIPKPVNKLIAVEAKQTRWKEAILQARRYTFFADQTYIAVWDSTVKSVDRGFLYRHRIGLISVEESGAEIIVEAPKRKPREPKMNLYCAEFLYGLALKKQKTPL